MIPYVLAIIFCDIPASTYILRYLSFHLLAIASWSVMAALQASCTFSVTSYDTALCLLPPVEQCEHIDSLRELYDRAYGRWPAHINLIYPFVAPEHLGQARQQIQAQLQKSSSTTATTCVKFDSPGLFKQRHNNTAILQGTKHSSLEVLEALRLSALLALGHRPEPHNFHLTVGQTEDNSVSSLEFLLSKLRLLPSLEFEVGSLAILVRERTSVDNTASRMRLWGTIDTVSPGTTSPTLTPEYWLNDPLASSTGVNPSADEDDVVDSATIFNRAVQPGKTFHFDQSLGRWKRTIESERHLIAPSLLTISSYNVLVDSEYPPARDRDPLLISTIHSESANADVLVLQEVSDGFLSSLLNKSDIQNAYPFTSHAPPSQSDIGPLPSLRNVVVLSKLPFRWEMVPFHRRHKGAVVAILESTVPSGSLVVAGVHLTCGLTDGSVAAKKVQAQNLIRHLTHHYNNHPWLISGDFNIATSTYTIESALNSRSISSQTYHTLSVIEDLLGGEGLFDAWSVVRDEKTSDAEGTDAVGLYRGEQGATFDPRNNVLAAATSGTSQNRPQRYDRILIRPQDVLRVTNFNMFGLPTDSNGVSEVPSDHYGVRASLQLSRPALQLSPDHHQIIRNLKVDPQRVPHLAVHELTPMLTSHHMFLTKEQSLKRKAAFALLKEVVLGPENSTAVDIPLVMVTVGSHAMDVDTSDSDIDCLCIGTISPKTFFKLVRQRLLKAEGQGIRILRKVDASTGTMLEISVNSIPMDLQYCPAARVVEK